METLVDGHDGCWMLEPTGLCGIESSAGYDAKPSTCKLFPFKAALGAGGQPLGHAARSALQGFPQPVRALALGALAYGDAQLSIE